MKLGIVVTTPEVSATPPVALLTGTFPEKLAKAKAMGYDGVELMPENPRLLDAHSIRAMRAWACVRVAGRSAAAVWPSSPS